MAEVPTSLDQGARTHHHQDRHRPGTQAAGQPGGGVRERRHAVEGAEVGQQPVEPPEPGIDGLDRQPPTLHLGLQPRLTHLRLREGDHARRDVGVDDVEAVAGERQRIFAGPAADLEQGVARFKMGQQPFVHGGAQPPAEHGRGERVIVGRREVVEGPGHGAHVATGKAASDRRAASARAIISAAAPGSDGSSRAASTVWRSH